MRKFFRSKKITTLVIALAFALALVPAVKVFADWGPSRPTFTWVDPATYVTFNSITDNPQVGDERAFLSGKDINSTGNVVDNINVTDNEEVVLRVFYHNNAASNLNLVSTNTRVKIFLPTKAATSTFATSFIVSDNANPRAVTDTVNFTGPRPFTLEYEPGTAQIWNNVFRGTVLNDNIVNNTGALIGFDKLTGEVPGCAEFSGYVTIKVRVHMPTPAPATTPVPTPTPTPGPGKPGGTLPNTGPGDIAGLFVGTSALGGVGHYLITRRRR